MLIEVCAPDAMKGGFGRPFAVDLPSRLSTTACKLFLCKLPLVTPPPRPGQRSFLQRIRGVLGERLIAATYINGQT